MLLSKINILLTDHYGYNNPACAECQSIYNNCSGEISTHYPGTGYPDLDIKFPPRNLGAFRKVFIMLFKHKNKTDNIVSEIIKTVESPVIGSKYPSVLDPSIIRRDIMKTVNESDEIDIQELRTDAGYQLVAVDKKSGLDFGNLPADIARSITYEYQTNPKSAVVIKKYPFTVKITIFAK